MSDLSRARRRDKLQARRLYAASSLDELRACLTHDRNMAAFYRAVPQINGAQQLEAYFHSEAGIVRAELAIRAARVIAWEPSFDKMEPDGPGR